MGDTDVPRFVDGVVDAVLDDQIVALHPDHPKTHVLNVSASLIWLSIDGVASVADIIDELHHETGIDVAVLGPDVRAAVAGFVATGLVAVGPHTVAVGPPISRAWRHRAQDRLLDGVAWSWSLGPVRAGAATVVVRTNAADLGDALGVALGALPPVEPEHRFDPRGQDPAPARFGASSAPVVVSVLDAGRDGPRRYRVFVDGERRWQGPHLDEVVPVVTTQINQLAIDGTPGRIRVHAGAVERDGRVIVVAGDSGRGKSTLVAALVQRGFAYVTDEVVAFDPETLAVLPYPKALDLDGPARTRLGLAAADHDAPAPSAAEVHLAVKERVAPSRLGTVSEGGRLELFVLLCDGAAAEAPCRDGSTTPSAGRLIELVATVFRASFDDDRTLDTLVHLPGRVPLLRLPRLELADAVAAIEAELAVPGPTVTTAP